MHTGPLCVPGRGDTTWCAVKSGSGWRYFPGRYGSALQQQSLDPARLVLPSPAASRNCGAFEHSGKTVDQLTLPRWESCAGCPGNKASGQPAEGLGDGVSHSQFSSAW